MLIKEGLLIKTETGKLHATAFGKAISLAGFKPESGVNLLKFLPITQNGFPRPFWRINLL